MNAVAETPPAAVAAHVTPCGDSVIGRLERAMLDLPQVELPPTHTFSDGIYSRHITIPAGVLLTGKVHRRRHLVIVAKGDISVYDEQHGVRRLAAPAVFESMPGARRMGYAHEETVFITVHATRTRDLGQLEAELFEPSAIADELARRQALGQGGPKP